MAISDTGRCRFRRVRFFLCWACSVFAGLGTWYLFAALGFYPVNPASGEYVIGSPLFKRVTLNLPNGKSFAISAPNNSARNVYIQSAALNGRPLDAPVISYAQIEAGGRVDFVMGPKPSTWAAEWRPQPVQ